MPIGFVATVVLLCKNKKPGKRDAFRASNCECLAPVDLGGCDHEDTARLPEACSPQQQHAQVRTANTLSAYPMPARPLSRRTGVSMCARRRGVTCGGLAVTRGGFPP